MLFETFPYVRSGTWLYDGTVVCHVRIVQHYIYYGSGDYEDPPEIANDREAECYYLLIGTAIGEPKWVGGGMAFSLAEAIKIAEEKLGKSLQWNAAHD